MHFHLCLLQEGGTEVGSLCKNLTLLDKVQDYGRDARILHARRNLFQLCRHVSSILFQVVVLPKNWAKML